MTKEHKDTMDYFPDWVRSQFNEFQLSCLNRALRTRFISAETNDHNEEDPLLRTLVMYLKQIHVIDSYRGMGHHPFSNVKPEILETFTDAEIIRLYLLWSGAITNENEAGADISYGILDKYVELATRSRPTYSTAFSKKNQRV